MKFPVETCLGCGINLKRAKPKKVEGPGEAPSVGLCPKCSAPYFMVPEVSEPEPSPEP